jgi:hypothetical protein
MLSHPAGMKEVEDGVRQKVGRIVPAKRKTLVRQEG